MSPHALEFAHRCRSAGEVPSSKGEVMLSIRWSHRTRRLAAGAVGVGGLVFGIGAPALAEGHFESYLVNWGDGKSSRQWIDNDDDATSNRATFNYCSEQFRVNIFREDWGPDTKEGTETVQCAGSTKDAVYYPREGHRDEYHFTIQEASDNGTYVDADVVVYW